MGFKMRSGNGPLKFKNMGASPFKQGVVTCPECGMQIENTDGSGAALNAHMATHLSGGVHTGQPNMPGQGFNDGSFNDPGPNYSNPGGWNVPTSHGYGSGIGASASTSGAGGTTASPRIGLGRRIGRFFKRMF